MNGFALFRKDFLSIENGNTLPFLSRFGDQWRKLTGVR